MRAPSARHASDPAPVADARLAASIAAIALAAAATRAAPATASLSTGNLGLDVQFAVGSGGNVDVRLIDGIATLSGDVHGASAKLKVRQAALAHPEVTQVVDLVTY